MVAIFTGAGAGFERSSANLLGGAGQLGGGLLGRGGEGVSVNAFTGNLLVSHQDEFLVGRGPDVGISRTYNSLAGAADGDNGDQWQQSTHRRVFGLTGTLGTAGSTISRLGGDGAVLVYSWDDTAGAYVSTEGAGAHDRLSHSAGEWTWTDGDSQVTETYSAHGTDNWRITAKTDRDGNALTFTYSGDKLDKVTTADGAWTQYVWSGNNITEIVTGYTDLATSTAETLTRTRYAYDASDRLVMVTTDLTPEDNSVADGTTYVTTYTYDGASNRIASIGQTDGSLIAITYDTSGRVETLTQTVASGVTRTTSISYATDHTLVTGPDGQVTKLSYDTQGRLTGIELPPAASGATPQTVGFSYDPDGNLASVTDGRGATTTYQYDANGNAVLVTDPNNNTVERTFDSSNRLITERLLGSDKHNSSAAHYSQYAYDAEGHLRYAVDASGAVVEYEYSAAGELLREIAYPGHKFAVGATALTEAGMDAWVAGLGDLSSVKIVEHAYDARGGRISTTSYSLADSSGLPLSGSAFRAVYQTYDQAGRLVATHREGQAAQSYVYDGMGRLIASTDLHGGTTNIAFNDAGLQTTITTASGYVSVSVFNQAGELISLAESGTFLTGGTSTYGYDENGRMRVATDASGRSSYFVYDNAGRKVADIDHLGGMIEYVYDQADRMVATVQRANLVAPASLALLADPENGLELASFAPSASAEDQWSFNIYDDAGRTIRSIDGEGGVAAFEYDESDRLVGTTYFAAKLSAAALDALKLDPLGTFTDPAAHADDAVSRIFYDEAGRLVGALDGEGYLTESVYDAAGQKITNIAYSAKASGDLANAVFGELRASVDASQTRVSRYIYDGQGQLAYTLDALRGLTSYSYDAAGNLVSQTQHACPVTPASFDMAGVQAAIIADAADRTSWSVYDDAGRLAYSIDAEGGVSAFAYDTSGRMIKSVQFANLHGELSSLPALSGMEAWAADPAQASDSANRVTRHWYNERGDMIFTVDAESYVKGYIYDETGRLLSESAWPDKVVVGDATTTAQVASLVAGAGDAISLGYTYDGAGRLLVSTDGANIETRYVYNAMGQRTDAYQADNAPGETVRTHFVYDNAGRLIAQHRDYDPGNPNAINATVTYAYDGLGNRISVTDPNGNTTTFAYDALGQVVQSTNALNGVTSYEYDAFGNVVKTTDPRGEKTYLYYDRLGRLVAERDAENYLTRTHYDRFGDVVRTERFALPVGTPAETGVVSFTNNGVAESAFSTPDEYLAYLERIVGVREAEAVAAEANAISLQAAADTLAQAAIDADLTVTDLEDQIANYSGPTTGPDFEAERTAALANRNAWLNDRRAWLQSANSAATVLMVSYPLGLGRDILEDIRDRYSREATVANQLVSSTAANKAAYIDQYYDNLIWQANNLGSDETDALADPLAWLIARRTDLTNSINSFAGLSGSSSINSTRQELLQQWMVVHAAIYDLQNNVHSMGWPNPNQANQVQALFNNVQNNPSYVPNGIYQFPLYPASYRSTTIINIHFDVLDNVEPEYENDAAAYQELLNDLDDAQEAADLAHDAADSAQEDADIAAGDAVSARAEADQVQADLTAANADPHLAFAAYLQAIADQADADADLAEANALSLQNAADLAAQAAIDANQHVIDLEDQIANYSGPTSVDLEADRSAALANINNWLDTREDWLKDAKLAVGALANSSSGLEAEVLSHLRDRYAREQSVVEVLNGILASTANKTSYINQYYDNLTWRANNLSSSRPAALANPLGWLQARLEDLENWISGQDDLLNSGGWLVLVGGNHINNTKEALKYLWLNILQSIYDLQNNTYSTGWPTNDSGIATLFANVQSNPSYVPGSITHTSDQAADYRATIGINAYFDAVGATGSEYGASEYQQLLSDLAVAQGDAADAHDTADLAQSEAAAAAAAVIPLRAEAIAAQNIADAALAAAQAAANNGEPTYDSIPSATNNIVEIDLATLGEAASTSYAYDRLGRVVQRVDADGYIEQSAYNALGQLVSFKRYAEGTAAIDRPATSFEYDNRGQLIETTDAMGFFEAYTYDAFGRRVTHVAKSHTGSLSAGGTTIFTYDKRGLLLSETLPIESRSPGGSLQASTVTNSYQYDARGNLTRRIEAAGLTEERVTDYKYDHLDRLIETKGEARAYHNHLSDVAIATNFRPTETITYDANGNVLKIVDAAGNKTVFAYDELDRKVIEINAYGVYSDFEYDANGNLLTARVYEQRLGQVPSVASVQSMPTGNYRRTIFSYDGLNRMTQSRVKSNNGQGPDITSGTLVGSSWNSSTADLITNYTYDSFGNVIKVNDAAGNNTFSYYDLLGRKIAQLDGDRYLTEWTYDAEGNVLSELRSATRVAGAVSTAEIPSVAADNVNDRLTTYTYDKVGNRLSESRHNVIIHTGNGGQELVTATISYSYNGLGQVTTKTEAYSETHSFTTDFSYDVGGRLVEEVRGSYLDYTGTAVTPTTQYRYDGLGNLVRTVEGSGAEARVTRYNYGAGGLLASRQDAENNVHYYFYDRMGRQVGDRYQRTDSAGVTHTEGNFAEYDELGRKIFEVVQKKIGSNWTIGQNTKIVYNAFGEVEALGMLGNWQQRNYYDSAGRMWATNAGDGLWKYFGYDKNGNQTIAITSAGANLSGANDNPLTFSTVLGMVGQANVNATYTKYDDRNLATSVVEEGRQLSDSTTATLTSSRTYNAFGEVLTETDATGAKITYTYNTMGRMIRRESPTVQITQEDGQTISAKPTENFYYDAAGRLVAQRDANGNLTRFTLLNGSGHGGTQALVVNQLSADGGRVITGYDQFGDARKIRRLVLGTDYRETAQTFDKLGRVTQISHASGLVENFEYDQLGQQIKRWNNVYGSGNKQTTDYDTEGRVIRSRAFGGDITTYSYQWNQNLSTAATDADDTGGYVTTTTYLEAGETTGLTRSETTDIFGRIIQKTDLGGHNYFYHYDSAGRLIKQTSNNGTPIEINYSYYNTGLVRGQIGNAPETYYEYDKAGRKTYESSFNHNDQTSQWEFVKQASVVYDALGRMTQFSDLGGPDRPAAQIDYTYDAAGNVRSVTSEYIKLDHYGNFGTTSTTKTKWNRYDSMNRLVLTDGDLVDGQIVRGANSDRSAEIVYNLAGERRYVITTYKLAGGTMKTEREDYTHDDAGRLEMVVGNQGTSSTGGTIRSRQVYDELGRLTWQRDYGSAGSAAPIFERTITYNAKGQIASETVNQRVSDGSGSFDLLTSNKTYTYYDKNGLYAMGQVGRIVSDNYLDGVDANSPDTKQEYLYYFFNDQTLSNIYYTPDTSVPGTIHTNSSTFDDWGFVRAVQIADGRPRTVRFIHDENGHVLSREEDETLYNRGNPRQIYYRFDGKQLGEISNDGTANITYEEAVTELGAQPPTNELPFRNGASTGREHADFHQHYDAVNSYKASSSSRSAWTVQSGDSLRSIAHAVWGDASLWYKIAEANGLSGNSSLSAGQVLTLPTNVVRTQFNAGTLKAYDPAQALGDLAPTSPVPVEPVQESKKGGGCGIVGKILLAVVAVAVAAFAAPAIIGAASVGAAGAPGFVAASGLTGLLGGSTVAAGSFAAVAAGVVGGAAAGALGSVVSQAAGLATGIQDKFNWSGVALAAIGGGIGGGFGAGGVLGGSDPLTAAARALVISGANQGIGLATGLQSKFDFAGVAAAGVGAGIGALAGRGLGATPPKGNNSIGNHAANLGVSAAAVLANAATRSAIEGSSLGRNIVAAIPDVVAQAIYDVVSAGVSFPKAQVDADPVATGGGGFRGGAQAGFAGGSSILGQQLPVSRSSFGAAYDPTGIMLQADTLNFGESFVDWIVNSRPGQAVAGILDVFESNIDAATDIVVTGYRDLTEWITTTYTEASDRAVNASVRASQVLGEVNLWDKYNEWQTADIRAGAYQHTGTVLKNGFGPLINTPVGGKIAKIVDHVGFMGSHPAEAAFVSTAAINANPELAHASRPLVAGDVLFPAFEVVTAGIGAAKPVASSLRVGLRSVAAESRIASKVTWVDENVGLKGFARDYNASAMGARSNALTQTGQAPALVRTMPDGTKRLVKFDGIDGEVMVDRKVSIVTTQKAMDQALRQSDSLRQNGLTARWEVPNASQQARAIKMLNKLNINNISVVVEKPW